MIHSFKVQRADLSVKPKPVSGSSVQVDAEVKPPPKEQIVKVGGVGSSVEITPCIPCQKKKKSQQKS